MLVKFNKYKMIKFIFDRVVALIGLGELPGFEAAKDFVQIEKRYKPDPENKAIYDDLFEDYKNIYKSLEKAYIIANGQRFAGEEQ